MIPSHLSDEAVAAFADGVLRGHARSRAARHVDSCAECREAVRAQREAVLALRQAPPPALPVGLFERLRGLPAVTPAGQPSAAAPKDGGAMWSAMAPVAAFTAAESRADSGTPSSADEQDDDDQHGMRGFAALFAHKPRRRG